MMEGSNETASDEYEVLDDHSTALRFLFEPSDGSVEFATTGAREWLTQERHESVEKLVDAIDFGESDFCRIREDGYNFLFSRMYGTVGPRLLITVSEIRNDAPDTADLLTERQLEVAEYAASGATGPEIADALDVEPSTVYDHLQKIYDRLNIGSRAELTRAIVTG